MGHIVHVIIQVLYATYIAYALFLHDYISNNPIYAPCNNQAYTILLSMFNIYFTDRFFLHSTGAVSVAVRI